MSAAFKDGDTNGVKFKMDFEHTYHKPTDKEVADARPCRLFLIGTFLIFLVGFLVASIVLIVITDKCNNRQEKEGVVSTRMQYQVSVESFKDSNGDGVGDLMGLKSQLNYIESLSASSILLNDVIGTMDFRMNPTIGTDEDLKALISSAKEKNIDVFLQINPVATSNIGDWFKKSAKNASDWFVWCKENATNNWVMINGVPAWHASSEIAHMRYYSYYGENLPMLNLRKKEVLEAVKGKLMYWLNFGIKGLLFTDVSRLTVDSSYQNNTNTSIYDQDCPTSHEVLSSLYETVNGEGAELWVLPGTSEKLTSSYYGTTGKPLSDVVLSDQMAKTEIVDGQKLNHSISTLLASPSSANKIGWLLGGPTYHRLASRLGDNQAQLVGLLLLTFPNQVVPFYGDEVMLQDDKDGKSTSVMVFENGANKRFTELAKLRSIDGVFTGVPQIIHADHTSLVMKYLKNSLVAVNFDVKQVVYDLGKHGKKGKVLFSYNENEVGAILNFKNLTLDAHDLIVTKIE